MLFEGISLRQLGPYKGGCPFESQKIMGFGILSLVLDDKYVGDCMQQSGEGPHTVDDKYVGDCTQQSGEGPHTVRRIWGFSALVVGPVPELVIEKPAPECHATVLISFHADSFLPAKCLVYSPGFRCTCPSHSLPPPSRGPK